MKGARQVRPDQLFDALRREPLPTPVGNVRPGIVDQNVEASNSFSIASTILAASSERDMSPG